LRIGVDARGLMGGGMSGVEQYIKQLLFHLAKLDQSNEYILFYNSLKDLSANIPDFGSNFSRVGFRIPNKILDPVWRFFGIPRLERFLGKIDLFFLPNIRVVPPPRGFPLVVTFHDLSFEKFPGFFSWDRRLWHWHLGPRRQARLATKIIADSWSTKSDLIKLYKVDPQKIEVVYLGVDEGRKTIDLKKNQARICRKYNLPETGFILHLGTIEPRKNLKNLIMAYKKITGEVCWPLVIAGAWGWLYKDLLGLVKKEDLEQRVFFTGFIEEADKDCLYGLAKLFVYPSFYEGFGLPILEAMKRGVPVITSMVSSLPEVTADAALIIDPFDVDELAEAMKLVFLDDNLRDKLIRKGFARAENFSWRKTAQETLRIFNEVVHGGK